MMSKDDVYGLGVIGLVAGAIATPIAAWLTHIVWCFQHHEYLLMIAGAIIAPIGVFHGMGLWLGRW